MFQEFNQYQIFFYAKPFKSRLIQLYNDGTLVGSLSFDDYKELPENTHTDTAINLKYMESDYQDVIDLLRNESPLHIWINGENGVGGLSTAADEPVGEGE